MNVDHEQFKRLCEDVAAIKRAVIGDEEFKVPGLVDKMNDIEKWKRKMDLRIAAVSGSCIGAFFVIKALFFSK